MKIDGCGDDDCIDVLRGEDIVEVLIDLCVSGSDFFFGAFGVLRYNVTNGRDFRSRIFGNGAAGVGTTAAGADKADADSAVLCAAADRLERDEGGGGQG